MNVRCPQCTKLNETSNAYGSMYCKYCKHHFSYYINILLNRFVTEPLISNQTIKRKVLWANNRGQCHYCRKNLTFEKSTFDHVIPQSAGGSNGLHNYVIACRKCNSNKQSENYITFVSQEKRVKQWPTLGEYTRYLADKMISRCMLYTTSLSYHVSRIIF